MDQKELQSPSPHFHWAALTGIKGRGEARRGQEARPRVQWENSPMLNEISRWTSAAVKSYSDFDRRVFFRVCVGGGGE